MKADDRLQLRAGSFDREAWTGLWDRLPERARRAAAEFVLQQLHALESGGRWNISWRYETNGDREESGAPIFEFDQPGDVITYKGSVQIGITRDEATNLELLVSVACLNIIEWQALKKALPDSSDLSETFKDYQKQEDQRFAEIVGSGKNPCRVLVHAAKFLAWCSSNSRSPDESSREAFAAEIFRQEEARYRRQQVEATSPAVNDSPTIWPALKHWPSHGDSYLATFSAIGVPLQQEHRCSEMEIAEAEARLQLVVPQSVREFYLVSGREPRTNSTHNRLIPPAEWRTNAGYLIFLEENQSVVFWGVATTQQPTDDAAVFQGVNRRDEGIEWHLECDSSQEFLNVITVWHASFGRGAQFCAVGYVVDQHSARETLSRDCTFLGAVNGMAAFGNESGVFSFLKWEDPLQKQRQLPPWRVFAAAPSKENLDRLKDALPAIWEEWGS